MKSRTSCCKRTLLKQDLIRFGPVAALYTIFVVLVSTLPFYNGDPLLYRLRSMRTFLEIHNIFSLIYAMVVAQCLFGDLYNTRLCYGLHSLPVKRDCQFTAHVVMGLLFAFIPNLLGGLVMMPALESYAGLAWLIILGSCLLFLFYFSLAVLSVMLSGNRFGMILCYGFLNFVSILAMWFATSVYGRLLHGVKVPEDPFMNICPSIAVIKADFFEVIGDYISNLPIVKTVNVIPSGFYLLGVLAAIGLVLLAVAHVLYRLRELECAGDLLAFQGIQPVVQLLLTLSVGAFLQLCGQMILNEGSMYILLLLGMVIGYVGSQMLIERQTNVFKLKNFRFLAGIILVLGVSIGITAMDPMGLVTKMPEDEDIASVSICQGNMNYSDGWIDSRDIHMVEPQQWEALRAIHRAGMELTDGPSQQNIVQALFGVGGYRGSQDGTIELILTYHLKNGKDFKRYYAIPMTDEEATKNVTYLLSSTDVLFGVDKSQWEAAVSTMDGIELAVWRPSREDFDTTDPAEIRSFMAAYLKDIEAGTAYQIVNYYVEDGVSLIHTNNDECASFSVTFKGGIIGRSDREEMQRGSVYLYLYRDNVNTIQWLSDHGFQIPAQEAQDLENA